MTEKKIDTQLLTYFHSLSKPRQLDVLNYLKSLLKKEKSTKSGLLKLAGSISPEDLDKMEEDIKDCEKIDKNEW